MKTWQLWTAACCIFLAGIVLGSIGTGVGIRHALQSGFQDTPGPFLSLLEHRLSNRLDLTPEQQTQAHTILLQGRQNMVSLRRRYQPEVRAIIVATKDELKAGLNPEQQQKLEEMYGDFSQHFPLIHEHRGQLQGRPSSMN